MRPVRAVAQAEDALPMSSPSDRRRGVVAGAGSGIGKAAALRLVSEGVDVLAVDINRDSLSELESAGCKTLAGDITDPQVRSRVADWAHGANYLVNSAGVIVIKSIFEVTVEEWRRMQTVNAEATFFLCQKIGPRLAPGGAIVNLSSSSAKLATTVEVAAYAASKTTILSITRSFAYALSSRPVRTKLVPLGRGSSPEECAGLIWFLLSDESAYMTGQAINFTGGLVTW
jgi:NAD(P)-dependent dehydrogenase (short-subunit alcohol dehydrogenase family)